MDTNCRLVYIGGFIISILFASCNASKVKKYYPDGHIKELFRTKNGVPDGECTSYYDNGNIYKQGYYNKGKLNGYAKVNYLNGRIAREGYYRNGILDSIEDFYDSVTGKVLIKANYKNDMLDGLYQEYYGNGRIKMECYYTQGTLDSIFKYYPNGTRQMYRLYKDGIGGQKIYYDRDGQMIPFNDAIIWWNNGTIRLGETYKVRIGDIYNTRTRHDKVRVFLGKLDESDSLIDSTSRELLPLINGSYAIYSITPKDTGTHTFSGILQYTKADGIKVRAPFRGTFYVKAR